jgi:tetratricopeptide (TPR) repeat protein
MDGIFRLVRPAESFPVQENWSGSLSMIASVRACLGENGEGVMAAMDATVRLGIWAALVVVSSLLAISQTIPNQLESVTAALRARQFDEALQLLQPELEQTPRNPKLWALRGIALAGKGNSREALAAYRHALSILPDYLPALEGAAQIEYDQGGNGAAPLLEEILKLHPADPTSHAMLAVLDYRRGDCAAAVPHFEQGGSVVDSQPEAIQAYGDCLMRLKETRKAIAIFVRALAQPNAGISARYRLASAQMVAQSPKDAIATLEPLLQQNTANADVLALAASAYEADRNTPEAVRVLRQAILSDPHNVNLYVDFANISLDHQSFQVGVDMINAGLAAEPKAAPLYVARGVLYVQLAQYDRAEADFEAADALNPGQSVGAAAEGLAAVQQNDPERALSTVRAKLARKPNDPFLLYLQAQILTERGPDPDSAEFHQAVKSAEKAISLRPSLAAARDVLGKLYLQAGENARAVDESRKALSSDPKDQTALYHLIQALRKSGQTQGIPDLLKQLAALRMEGTKEESERNRYKLVEEKLPTMEKPQP